MTRWHRPPAELYALVEHTPATVLLESANPGESVLDLDLQSENSCSRLFTSPLSVRVAHQSNELPALFAEIETAVAAGHFCAGFFTYECGSFFEPTAALHPSPPGQPLAWFGIYDRPWLFDHRTGTFRDGDPPILTHFRGLLQSSPEESLTAPVDSIFALTEPQYTERIEAIHELIRAGDIYQLNFTVPMRVHVPGSTAALYQRLHARQPAPHSAFLHPEPDRRILSFSPELFFRLDDRRDQNQNPIRHITTRPMKGTAQRGRTTREDSALVEWLRNDPKNRSENVMIVDLLRNDLGRLCHYGSVRTDNLFAVERYPTLWQMTSTVTGTLRPEINFQQIFRALFPCGSITGAPKVRAMQLLSQLEGQPRGIYTGAIGFFSRDQSVFNVAIRTLDLEGEDGTMSVGSGIVIDSDPAGEFRECLLKAEFLTRSSPVSAMNPADLLPDNFSLVETLLWHCGYPLIELHLDRLEDSASYFGFPCDRTATKDAFLTHAAAFAQTMGGHQAESTGPARKVRLLLNSDGSLHITDEIVPGIPDLQSAQPLRVRIATQRADSCDPMLFHKTTHRPIYAEAFQAATQAGYDDVLFLNTRGEVTEAAIHNIFVEKDGNLFTPPIECGLLAGVQRRHILESHPNAEEKIIYPDDLRHADAVYLSNAVRGLRRAIIDWQDE